MSDLNEQAEAVRKMNDEQLGDYFELLHWVVRETNVPPHIYRIAVNLLEDRKEEIERGVKAKDKR